MNNDTTLTVRWVGVSFLPIVTCAWIGVAYILYQERYQAKYRDRFQMFGLSRQMFPQLLSNFFLFIPLMICLVLAANKHPDAPILFSRIFIIAVVFNDTKEAIGKAVHMPRKLFIFNFVTLGIAQCLLLLPPVFPHESMIFVGVAISFIMIVEGIDTMLKFSYLTSSWQKVILFISISFLILSISLSIAASIWPARENVLTIAATTAAIGYSTFATWIGEIVDINKNIDQEVLESIKEDYNLHETSTDTDIEISSSPEL
eukprot:TRINITY_DN11998_c0_g3_i1.p1 TRINITY_DN11998_c0_g3~~TRINITY_DN11998_c0_g3_i1.p1  ORF type:complete len:259 (+),score=15.89 TRINITY_DN11998_c0_g3_i1:355-1131(+)